MNQPAFKYNDTMKRILLHDIGSFYLKGLLGEIPEDIRAIDADQVVASCDGCCSCWIETPGLCIVEDKAHEFAYDVMDADELIIISRLCFGTFSPEIKSFLDRMLPCLLPFYEMREGRMRHPMRSENRIGLRFYFYSAPAISPDEKPVNVRTDKRSLIEVAENHKKSNEEKSILAAEEELDIVKKHTEAIAANMHAISVQYKYVGEMRKLSEVKL